MASLLLCLIYLAFISLGLPDSLLGAAWPVMQADLSVPLSSAGAVTMIISGSTMVSSLFSDRVIRRFGTGAVTTVSVALTACGLFGFSVSGEFFLLCIFAIPYGLGAGAIDTALNNYVAIHYSARHMSWLHAFWGIGITVSPYIMSYCLTRGYGWQSGYRSVALVQSVMVCILFFTLPIWKKAHGKKISYREIAPEIRPLPRALRIKGVPFVILTLFAYCAMESTAGLWATSYMVNFRGAAPETASRFAALFYLGITAGRLIGGLAANRLGDRTMIRIGLCVMLGGITLLALPFPSPIPALTGLVVIGLGAAPIYPSVIHSTPDNFPAAYSQSLVGIQMTFSYVGSTLMPPVFGLIAEHVHIGLYPLYLGFFALLMLLMTELLKQTLRKGTSYNA